MPSDARARAFSALARFQLADATIGDTLTRISEITVEAVPAAAVAGLTMLGDDGQPTTAVYTDADSPEIDAAQYREGKGPCLDAWRLKKVVRLDRVEDAAAEYPGFVTACRDHAVRSTLSLPMISGDASIGAMNLYSPTAGAFTDEDELLGMELAAAAGSVLANAAAYSAARELGHQLNEAMQSRAVIEQAKGILMARSPDLSADAAFDVLRRASQRENLKLREIAQRVVDGRRVPSGREAGAAG